jgi:hypothetical protein
MSLSNAERQRRFRQRRKERRAAPAAADITLAPPAPSHLALPREQRQHAEPALPEWYWTVIGDQVVRRRFA